MAVAETRLLLRTIRDDGTVRTTTLALAVLVVLLVVLFVATAGPDPTTLAARIHRNIDLGRDRSMGEMVGYGFAFLSAALFLAVFVESRSPLFLFLSLVMFFVWFDDSMHYHERVGTRLSEMFVLPQLPGLRAQDSGELIAWAIAGLLLAPPGLLAFFRRSPGDAGAFGAFLLCFLALAACGIGVDLAHVAAPQYFDLWLIAVEDGGELIALALISGLSLALVRNHAAYAAEARRLHATPPRAAAPGRDRPAAAAQRAR